jgi:MinD superfamily P-loop ATPase
MRKIAIASGKGGTGKTTIATNLAAVASRNSIRVAYLDCDVEEPNGALFLKPRIEEKRPVNVSVPGVQEGMCTGCGLCRDICQYGAVAVVNRNVLVFPELCHGCAGCWMVCETSALVESQRTIGQIEIGRAEKVDFVQGILNIGEAMSPPVIRQVKTAAVDADLQVIDSPPGTSCPVIESIRDADYVVLVTEPTPFGLNDLVLAVETVRTLVLPFGVVINRSDTGDGQTLDFCREQGIDILAEIPDDRRVAEAYSRGELACDTVQDYSTIFASLVKRLLEG